MGVDDCRGVVFGGPGQVALSRQVTAHEFAITGTLKIADTLPRYRGLSSAGEDPLEEEELVKDKRKIKSAERKEAKARKDNSLNAYCLCGSVTVTCR